MEVIRLTKDLISIYSPSGNEEEVGKLIKEGLEQIGLNIKIQQLGKRFNILAFHGNPKIILSTHMDTVPGFLKVRENKTFIYGRGSCDAKGVIASMICAAEIAVKERLSDFGLLFTVSEETDFSGIKKATQLVSPKFVIIGEPTNLKLAFGQRGLIGITAKSFGKSAAGATPGEGKSAIYQLIDFISEIRKNEFSKSQILGNTSLNIGTIKGGEAINVVPSYAEANLEIRSVEENNRIIKRLNRIARKFNVKLRVNYSYEPVVNKVDERLLKCLDVEATTVPYFTEAYFWRNKAKTYIFGPGDYKYAHTNKERVNKNQLRQAVKKYYYLVKYFDTR